MKLTMDAKMLVGCLKAVEAFMSEDVTRKHLCQVEIKAGEGKVRFSASDGVSGCTVTSSGEGHGTVCVADVHALICQIKSTKGPVTIELEDTKVAFPPLGQVIPADLHKPSKERAVSFDPSLLLRGSRTPDEERLRARDGRAGIRGLSLTVRKLGRFSRESVRVDRTRLSV
jgi:hypothetical protein